MTPLEDINTHGSPNALEIFQSPLAELKTAVATARSAESRPQAHDNSEQEAEDYHKRLESRLREREEQYRQIVASVTDGLIVFDLSGKVVEANPAALEAYGYSRAEFLGLAGTQVDRPGCRHLFDTFMNQATDTGQCHVESIEVRKDGSTFYVEVRGRMFRFRGKPHLLAVVRDVSERKHAEQELKKYAAALESSNRTLQQANLLAERATRAKSAFLANMSHEIRTPMTAILGYADVLRDCITAPEAVDAVTTIHRNGEHLLNIINSILDLSAVEAGRVNLESTVFSPTQLLEEVVSLMRAPAKAKNLPIHVEYMGPVPENVNLDRTRLRQILINLIGNAIKFTETGSVRVTMRLLDHDSMNPRLHFDVIDTGIGMTEELIAKLFQPFFQGDSSVSRKFGGTGLGLAISARLVNLMGGDIRAAGCPGKGSTFSLTIPVEPIGNTRMSTHPSESVARNREQNVNSADTDRLDGRRILLAEDGPDNQRLISFILKKAGADVVVCENGQVAVEAVFASQERGGSFDLILMDMQMPVMDGYETTRHLRSQGYRGPIVALTAHAMAGDRQKCLDAGCDEYISKPVDRARLLSLVAKSLRR